MTIHSRALFSTLASLLVGGAALAIPTHRAEAQNPVSWSLTLPEGKTSVAAGSKVLVNLKAAIDDGWHIYAPSQAAGGPIAMKVTVVKNPAFVAADSVKEPTPDTKFDSNFGINVETYQSSATFGVPVNVGHISAGTDTLKVTVRYQACTESMCLPARNQTVALPVAVAAK